MKKNNVNFGKKGCGCYSDDTTQSRKKCKGKKG